MGTGNAFPYSAFALDELLRQRKLEQLAGADRAEKIRQFNVGAAERARAHDLNLQIHQNALQQQAEQKQQIEADRAAATQSRFFEGMTPADETGTLRTMNPQTAAAALLGPYSGQIQRTIPMNDQGQPSGEADVFQTHPGRQWVEKRQEAADKFALATAAREAKPPPKPDVLLDPTTGRVISALPTGAGTHVAPHQPPQEATPVLEGAALDMAAIMYAKTGQLPPMGMGKTGAQLRTTIINRAAAYNPETGTFAGAAGAPDIAANKAGFAGNQASQTQLQKNVDAVTAFANTAKKNTALLTNIAAKIPGAGLPLLNGPIRGLARVLGNEDVASFEAIRQSVANEYMRLISQPNLSGILSDQARREGDLILKPSATPAQIIAATRTLATEGENRRTEYQAQLDVIKQRIRGGSSSGGSTFRVISSEPIH